MPDEVPLKEHLEKLIAEQDKRAALALAALNKNRSETISYIALIVAILSAVIGIMRK